MYLVELHKPAQFGPETKLIELPFSWSLDDFVHFEFLRTKTTLIPGPMNASAVRENWIEAPDGAEQLARKDSAAVRAHPSPCGPALIQSYYPGHREQVGASAKLAWSVAHNGGACPARDHR